MSRIILFFFIVISFQIQAQVQESNASEVIPEADSSLDTHELLILIVVLFIVTIQLLVFAKTKMNISKLNKSISNKSEFYTQTIKIDESSLNYKSLDQLLDQVAETKILVSDDVDSAIEREVEEPSEAINNEENSELESLPEVEEAVLSNEIINSELNLFNEAEGEAPFSRDDLFDDAAKLMVINQRGTLSLLQSKLNISSARSKVLMDELELYNIVGPFNGNQPRMVLIGSTEELERYLNTLS